MGEFVLYVMEQRVSDINLLYTLANITRRYRIHHMTRRLRQVQFSPYLHTGNIKHRVSPSHTT